MARSAGSSFEIAVIVTPGFNMAATMSFIDPFRAANYLEARPLFRWHVVSIDAGDVTASNRLRLATAPLAEIGGVPDLAVVSASWTPEAFYGPPLDATLRRWARFGAALGALDTGAFLLARAGLLDGRRATVHFEHLDSFAETYPQVEASDALYVIDRDRLTCCGGEAAADLALQVVRAQAGPALANAAARYLFHDRVRAAGELQNPEHAQPVGLAAPARLRAAVARMERNLDDPVPIPAIATELDLSQRQLERLFLDHTGLSPVRYYRGLRLDHARGLVTQAAMPIREIALACGFRSAEHFARAYRSRFGIAPSVDRTEGRVPFEFRAWPMRSRTGAI